MQQMQHQHLQHQDLDVSTISIFHPDGIKPDNVRQGRLGDCWFLSAAAVLAERPELVRRLFLTQTLQREGVYAVRLFHNGEWQVVIVDDLIPVDRNERPIYSQLTSRGHTWVVLLEKAFAKLHGSYHAIEGGLIEEALSVLTGFPCERISLDSSASQNPDPLYIWARIKSAHEANYLLGASTGTVDAARLRRMESQGIHANHAYSILDVQEIRNAEGHLVKLVRLRNPWGSSSKQWTGRYSARDPVWTAALREKLSYKEGDLSVFWMPYEDFLSFFTAVTFCKYDPNWKRISVQGILMTNRKDIALGQNLIEFSVSTSMTLMLSIIQTNIRGEQNTHYNDLGAIVFRRNRVSMRMEDIDVLGFIPFKRHYETIKEFHVQPKDGPIYIAIASLVGRQFVTPENARYAVCMYAPHEFRASTSPLDIRTFTLATQAAVGKFAKSSPLGDQGMLYMAQMGDMIVWMAANFSDRHAMEVTLDPQYTGGYVFSRNTPRVVDTIPPLSRKVWGF
eukprot:TRINITY_DN5776_c0_g1_i1.p1 TRINITY_DN5776_c0_g1~~TRINITY_DN5776_c0_g1_i1.p1  ORF type:complete len:541 (+),score=95.86 TRINITY_DN5776_c0_g1_i1:104-1624(+)